MDRLLRERQRSRACNPYRDIDVPQRSYPRRRDSRGAAQRQHVLFWLVSLWRGVEPARSGGHPGRAAGMVASHCHAGAYNNRWTIVVDDDIDPTNFNDVIWAMCTRCDPRDQIDIIHGGWSSALDPMCYDTEHDRRNSRVVIDACIPFRRKKTFPPIARSSKALDERLRQKWAKDLPNGF